MCRGGGGGSKTQKGQLTESSKLEHLEEMTGYFCTASQSPETFKKDK